MSGFSNSSDWYNYILAQSREVKTPMDFSIAYEPTLVCSKFNLLICDLMAKKLFQYKEEERGFVP